MAQHDPHHLAVLFDGLDEAPLRPAVEPSLLGFRMVLQNSGRHHRRQRQRDERREYDRDRERHREFAEQAAHDVRHEQQRNQHGDQRNGQRNDGEADFRRALERGLHRRIAHFDVAGDVFDHHDRVVHDETGRNRQRHQRKVVEAVAEQVHHGERADQRKRHRDARNDGGREAAQEQEDHHHDQRDGQHQLEFDVLHRGADGRGAVGDDLHVDAFRQRGFDLRKQRLNGIDDADDVGARLPLNVQNDGRVGVHPRGVLGVLRAVDDGGHVGKAHRRAVAVGDDDRPVLRAGLQLIVIVDRPRLIRAVEIAFGLIDVGAGQARSAAYRDSGRRRRARRDSPARGRPGAVRR